MPTLNSCLYTGNWPSKARLADLALRVRRRLHTDYWFLGMRRDIAAPVRKAPTTPLIVRRMFHHEAAGVFTSLRLSNNQIREHRELLDAGARNCYISVTPDGAVHSIQWLIVARDQHLARPVMSFPCLSDTEAFLEHAFARHDRVQNVLLSTMPQLVRIAQEGGARYLLGVTCVPPIFQILRWAGFAPDFLKHDSWLLLRRQVTFHELPVGDLAWDVPSFGVVRQRSTQPAVGHPLPSPV